MFSGYAAWQANILIGNKAGYNETGNNILYITDSSTNEPLVYGDFATSELTFNVHFGFPKNQNFVLASPFTNTYF